MPTQISIPSSDGDSNGRAPAAQPRRRQTLLLAALAVLVAGAYLAIDRPSVSPTEDPTVIVGSPRDTPVASDIDLYPSVAVEATRFPGTGVVSAILDDGAALTVFVAESHAGTAVWHRQNGDAAWQLVDDYPGVDIVDAVSFDGIVVAVGIRSDSRAGVVLSGEFGSMVPIEVAFDRLETPHQLSVVDQEVFVMTRRGDPALADVGGRLFRSVDGSAFTPESVGPVTHGIETVVLRDDAILAFGRAGSAPAGWDVTRPGDPQPLEIGLDGVEGSIRAAAVSPHGDLLGLVSESLGFRIPGTSVYQLEPPFDQLTVPIPGVWDRLVPDDATLVALPVEGSRTLVTADGRLWSLREERFDPLDVGLTPRNEEQSEWPLLVTTYSVAPDRVIVGGRGGPDSDLPVVGSLRDVGRSFDVPTDAWTMVDELAGGVAVHHFGTVHIGSLNEVVVVREGFGDDWTQPVFADQPSVGGIAQVIETELGFLLHAQRPVPLLWFSRTGRAWEPIASNVVGVAGHGDEILIVESSTEGLTVTRIGDGDVTHVDSNLSDFASTGHEMGWVDGLGYVFGPLDGALIRSMDGSFWTVVPTPVEVADIVMSDGHLAVRPTLGPWMGYRSETQAFERSILPDLSGSDFQMFEHRNRLTILTATGSYVSADALDWIDVSTGIWEGVDGVLYDAWILEDEVIGLIGDDSHRALFTRPRSSVTTTR